LFKVWFIQDSGLFRVWFRQVYTGFWFIQGLVYRFIQDSGLFRVWFRQVSPYIHNESKLTKERKKNHGGKRLLTPFEGFFLLPQGKRGDN